MKNKNIYGFYSGGYIFDQLDRKALESVRKVYSEFSKKFVFTSDAHVIFMKQLCDDKNLEYSERLRTTWDGGVECNITMTQRGVEIACANFIFRVKDKSYCDNKLSKHLN